MFFLGGTVIDDLFFFCGQITEWHIGAHAHLPTNIGHQRPHQAVPRGDRAAVNGQRIVRDKRIHIDRADGSGSAAGLARALRIEGKLFGRRRVKMHPAFGADKLLSCRDRK